jgi:hypothetical protein
MKSYTTSRKPAGINRNTAVSENGNPSRLNIRRTAVERSSTRPSSTTVIEPTPDSGRQACRENAAPDSDCRAVNRKTSLRSNCSKKSTQRLQNAHSPSKTTTACREESTTLLSQAEHLHSSIRNLVNNTTCQATTGERWPEGATCQQNNAIQNIFFFIPTSPSELINTPARELLCDSLRRTSLRDFKGGARAEPLARIQCIFSPSHATPTRPSTARIPRSLRPPHLGPRSRLREVILEEAPNASEAIYQVYTVAIWFGFSRKMNRCSANIS